MKDLSEVSRQLRRDIIEMITEAGSGHPGGSLSAIDALCALYLGGVMQYDPQDPDSPDRDRFILSKGHAAPALYAMLAHIGFIPHDELKTLRKVGSRLQGHPDSNLLPGVEVSTGSLGQGLSIACGVACGQRIANKDARTFTMLGDGECQEGQVWEAAMFAAHHKLGNLIAIVDKNGLQIDGKVEDVMSICCLREKFEAFGWKVTVVPNGHDIPALIEALKAARADEEDVPKVVVAKTVKGKGVSFMEGQAGWHGKAPNAEQAAQALEELAV